MEEQHIVADRTLIRTARVISAIFTPFSIPFLAFLILFLFSYLRIMPIQYKLIVLGVVYCFTILMPTLTIFLFRKINGFSPEDLGERKRRFMPFLLTITSYVFCLVMMHRLNIPWYMTGIILAALIMMVICIVVNLKWKLSEHMAGVGAIVGGLVSFSALFGYNPVWWLCLFILIAGVLGTARIILQHHTLGEVLVGFAVGLICSLLVLHPASDPVSVDLLNYCLDHMLAPQESIGVQALSIRMAYQLCKSEPELLKELQLILENADTEYYSTGVKTTIRNILKKINK